MIGEKYSTRLIVINGMLLFILDVVLLGLSCFLSYYLRFYTDIFREATYSGVINSGYILYSLIFIGSAVIFFSIFRLYSINKTYKNLYHYFQLIVVLTGVLIAVYLAARFIDNFYLSRIWIAFVIIFSVIFVSLGRIIYGKIMKTVFRKAGTSYEDLIIDLSVFLRTFKENTRIRKKVIYGLILGINDIFFLGAAFYLSYYLRFSIDTFEESQIVYFIERNYLFYSFVFIISALLIFSLFRLYNWDNIYRGSGYYSRIVKGIIINIVVIILSGYIFELFTFSRKWILLLLVFSLVFIFISRFLIDYISARLIRKAQASPATIIIGMGENSKRIEDSFKKYSLEADEILGYVEDKDKINKNRKYSKDFNILGHLDELREIIYRHKVQRVIISGPEYKYFELLEMLEKLKGLDISVLVFPGFFEFSVKRMNIQNQSDLF